MASEGDQRPPGDKPTQFRAMPPKARSDSDSSGAGVLIYPVGGFSKLASQKNKASHEQLRSSTQGQPLTEANLGQIGGQVPHKGSADGYIRSLRMRQLDAELKRQLNALNDDDDGAPTTTMQGDAKQSALQQPRFQIGQHEEDVFASVAQATEEKKELPPVELKVQPKVAGQPSNDRNKVDGVDAQTYYPPNCCVFVANLPENRADSVLEVAITRAFSRFGPVFIKIRRDAKNMPFAFCQYTDPRFAEKAYREGKGMMIEGRICRTEMVKANRAYLVKPRTKMPLPSLEDIHSQIEAWGEIEKIEPLSNDSAEALDLKGKGAVYVLFRNFDPARDIVASFRYHSQIEITVFDLKKPVASRAAQNDAYLNRYEVDRRSIYIGNIPHNIVNLEDVIRGFVDQIGTVANVQVVQKPARNEGGNPTIFAFVEFRRPDEATSAIERLRGFKLLGARLRVELKNAREQLGSSLRRGPAQQSPAAGDVDAVSPTPGFPASSERIPKTVAHRRQPITASHFISPQNQLAQGNQGIASPNVDTRGFQPGRTFASPGQVVPGHLDQTMYGGPQMHENMQPQGFFQGPMSPQGGMGVHLGPMGPAQGGLGHPQGSMGSIGRSHAFSPLNEQNVSPGYGPAGPYHPGSFHPSGPGTPNYAYGPGPQEQSDFWRPPYIQDPNQYHPGYAPQCFYGRGFGNNPPNFIQQGPGETIIQQGSGDRIIQRPENAGKKPEMTGQKGGNMVQDVRKELGLDKKENIQGGETSGPK
ncbi:hypothetical protein F5Y16DRAFT_404277 [Xylariaceae sp. FL0255]|nr:hypothetical protein F5Y16DRAFT_404277 [Xylariaceae sp. FL0255]